MTKKILYRGVKNLESVPNPYRVLANYTFWTDNLEIAKHFGDIILMIEVEKKDIEKDMFCNDDGDRSLVVNCNSYECYGNKGREYIIYDEYLRSNNINLADLVLVTLD
ncbi:MAG: hypothetical protein ACRCXZ_03300 [Patescibacteria group bacterium]